METKTTDQENLELCLEEFGEAPPGVEIGTLVQPSVLPAYLKTVPLGDSNAFLVTMALVNALLEGIPFSTACMMSGFTESEIAAVADEHRPVARALNYAYAVNLRSWIQKLRQGDQKAAMFYLERGVPTLFGEARSVGKGALLPSISDVRSDKKSHDYKNLSDAELVALAGES